MPSPFDIDAAKLALLAARASVSRNASIRGPLLRVPSTRERFTPEAIVQQLAAAPKPLVCSARDAGGSIEISYSTLMPGTREFESHERSVNSARERGGYMHYLTTDRDTVYCVGRGETLLLPARSVEQWHRDYDLSSVNLRGDRVDNPWCIDWPDYREAKVRGAAGLMIFTSPVDNPIKAYMIIQGEE